MSELNSNLLKQALELPQDQRAELAQLLIDSLDAAAFDSPEIAAARKEEIRRRVEQIDRGEVQLIPAEEVFRKLNERRRAQAPS